VCDKVIIATYLDTVNAMMSLLVVLFQRKKHYFQSVALFKKMTENKICLLFLVGGEMCDNYCNSLLNR